MPLIMLIAQVLLALYSLENIKLVQAAINDKVSNLETTALSTEHAKEEVGHKEGTIQHPIRSKFVE